MNRSTSIIILVVKTIILVFLEYFESGHYFFLYVEHVLFAFFYVLSALLVVEMPVVEKPEHPLERIAVIVGSFYKAFQLQFKLACFVGYGLVALHKSSYKCLRPVVLAALSHPYSVEPVIAAYRVPSHIRFKRIL